MKSISQLRIFALLCVLIFVFSVSSCNTDKTKEDRMKTLVLNELGLLKWYDFEHVHSKYDSLFEITKVRNSLYHVVFNIRLDIYFSFMIFADNQEETFVFQPKEHYDSLQSMSPLIFNKILLDNNVSEKDSIKYYFSIIFSKTTDTSYFKIINSENDLVNLLSEKPVMLEMRGCLDTSLLSFNFCNEKLEFFLWKQFDGLYKISIESNKDTVENISIDFQGCLGNELIKL